MQETSRHLPGNSKVRRLLQPLQRSAPWRWSCAQAARYWNGLKRIARVLRPQTTAWRHAAWGIVAAVAGAILVHTFALVLDMPGPNPYALLVMGAIVVLPTLAVLVALLLAGGVLRLPVFFRIVLLSAAAVLFVLFGFYVERAGTLLSVGAVLLFAALLGAGVGRLVQRSRVATSRTENILALGNTAAGVAFFGFAIFWVLDSGTPIDEPPPLLASAADMIDAPDPSRHGDFSVAKTTYGGGADRRREEFGAQAAWTTEPVDGSKLLDGWEGFSGWLRSRYWGFDASALPLQGRVWYPDDVQGEEGPYPLIIAVHGNHMMEDFSDHGYAYLGEQFASRGYIFVSVDQNFLNLSLIDQLGGGLRSENDARGWLLLEHLRAWREWNDDPEHDFYGKVDTGSIALIGHSRGGEAVAVAAAFNRLPFYPDNANVVFDYNFNIRGIAAIAPVDGQYRPAGAGTPLHDVNYFTIQGGYDGDMTSFDGAHQYDRVAFSPGYDGFKSAVHVATANHGQFNTHWGRFDYPPPIGWLLNTRPLMSAEDQQQVARVYLGAFMELTLRDDTRYLAVFHDPRRAASWLPENRYAAEFNASNEIVVANFKEDLDLTSATLPGASMSQQHLTDWREQRIRLRMGLRPSHAVYLGWTENDTNTPRYTITLPESMELEAGSALTFALADSGSAPTMPAGEAGGDGEAEVNGTGENGDDAQADDDDEENGYIDLGIELVDGAGNVAVLPLSHRQALLPALRPKLVKSSFIKPDVQPEPVFQTFVLPLAEFSNVNTAFDPRSIRSISLVFDRTRQGLIVLNHVGFTQTDRNNSGETVEAHE